jgi:hypothetical protein
MPARSLASGDELQSPEAIYLIAESTVEVGAVRFVGWSRLEPDAHGLRVSQARLGTFKNTLLRPKSTLNLMSTHAPNIGLPGPAPPMLGF